MKIEPRFAILIAGIGTLCVLAVGFVALSGVSPNARVPKEENLLMSDKSSNDKILVSVVDTDGKLTDPVLVDRVERTDAEWRELLTDEEYRVMRNQGTEPPFCGTLLDNKKEGVYACRGCNLPLFSSDAKFKSGTGWPSFYQPIGENNILERSDVSHGMVRTEVLCPRCESHLGHVFPDGPKPTGLRYCLNSESLKFVDADNLKSIGETVDKTETAEAVFAGGCFWCVEGVFEQIDGVLDVTSGYAGGDADSANYKAVSRGETDHAEAVRIRYNPEKVSYEKLLEIHFATHDPTTLNRQGADTGKQYRSAIFYADDEQKAAAKKMIAHLEEEKKFEDPIVTALEPLGEFHEAEEYHQDYVRRNPNQPYVRAVAVPKLEKTRAKFSDLLAPKQDDE